MIIEGYIFGSRDRRKFILDTGPKEYVIKFNSKLEVWDGDRFVSIKGYEIEIPQMIGTRARMEAEGLEIDLELNDLDLDRWIQGDGS